MMQRTMEVSALPAMNRELTMSSREIASLTGSNHSDVKRSADRLFIAQILTQPLAEFPFEHNGNQYAEYRFNKRDSLVLVARLSPQFTAKIVDRWQELESRMQPLIPQTLQEALRLAADLAEEKQKLESELAIATPKAHDLFTIPLCRIHHDELHRDPKQWETTHGNQIELLFNFLNRSLGIGAFI